MPDDNDIGQFLMFVHGLLRHWTDQVDQRSPGFEHLGKDDRMVIKLGWEDFNAQWEMQREALMQAVKILQSPYMNADLQRRGLVGPAMSMKLYMIRKSLHEFLSSLRIRGTWRRVSASLRIRRAWSKLFERVDIVVDSVKDALGVVPGAGAIVSGLKEFKDIAMTTSKEDAGSTSGNKRN